LNSVVNTFQQELSLVAASGRNVFKVVNNNISVEAIASSCPGGPLRGLTTSTYSPLVNPSLAARPVFVFATNPRKPLSLGQSFRAASKNVLHIIATYSFPCCPTRSLCLGGGGPAPCPWRRPCASSCCSGVRIRTTQT
jgi:hypothetical protein